MYMNNIKNNIQLLRLSGVVFTMRTENGNRKEISKTTIVYNSTLVYSL